LQDTPVLLPDAMCIEHRALARWSSEPNAKRHGERRSNIERRDNNKQAIVQAADVAERG
jgi:hypothetical protein